MLSLEPGLAAWLSSGLALAFDEASGRVKVHVFPPNPVPVSDAFVSWLPSPLICKYQGPAAEDVAKRNVGPFQPQLAIDHAANGDVSESGLVTITDFF